LPIETDAGTKLILLNRANKKGEESSREKREKNRRSEKNIEEKSLGGGSPELEKEYCKRSSSYSRCQEGGSQGRETRETVDGLPEGTPPMGPETTNSGADLGRRQVESWELLDFC